MTHCISEKLRKLNITFRWTSRVKICIIFSITNQEIDLISLTIIKISEYLARHQLLIRLLHRPIPESVCEWLPSLLAERTPLRTLPAILMRKDTNDHPG